MNGIITLIKGKRLLYLLGLTIVCVGIFIFGVNINAQSNTPTACIEQWECGGWSDCISGKKTRDCVSRDYCINPPTSQECTVEETNDSDVEPEVKIVIPHAGEGIYGTITLTATATGTFDRLEFYWKNDNQSNMLIGSGSANTADPSIFEKSWDTSQVPDGDYIVYARTVTSSEEYYAISNEVSLKINNSEIDLPASSDDQPTESTDTDSDSVSDFEEILDNKNSTGVGSLDKLVDEQSSPTGNDGIVWEPEVIAEEKEDNDEMIEQASGVALDQGWVTQEEVEELERNLKFTDLTFVQRGEVISLQESAQELTFFNDENIVLSGVAQPNSDIKITLKSEEKNFSTVTNNDGFWTYTISDNLGAGVHTVKVEVYDTEGNRLSTSEPHNLYIVENTYTRTVVAKGGGFTNSDQDNMRLVIWFVAILISMVLLAYLVLVINKKKPRQIVYKK